jgi:hypothetical protein
MSFMLTDVNRCKGSSTDVHWRMTYQRISGGTDMMKGRKIAEAVVNSCILFGVLHSEAIRPLMIVSQIICYINFITPIDPNNELEFRNI